MSLSPATTRRRMLHFVSRVDDSNAGDRVASPLTHYAERFAAFPFRRHDIRYIDWDAIRDDDVVILGGGGMFDHTEFMNRAINRLLRVGAPVIAWAPGFNTHFGLSPSFRTPIDFDRFTILTVRDFENEHAIPYLPDVTCVMPQLRTTHEIRRRFGVAHHKDFPLDFPGHDAISNETSVEEILTFIGESEIVVSNSYHMIYWATLMGKRCLSPGGFSTKFDGFEYPPTFIDPGEDLEDAARRARSYDVLDACIEKTDLFPAGTLECGIVGDGFVSRALNARFTQHGIGRIGGRAGDVDVEPCRRDPQDGDRKMRDARAYGRDAGFITVEQLCRSVLAAGHIRQYLQMILPVPDIDQHRRRDLFEHAADLCVQRGVPDDQIGLQGNDTLEVRLPRVTNIRDRCLFRCHTQVRVLRRHQRRADNRQTEFEPHSEIIERIEHDNASWRHGDANRRAEDVFRYHPPLTLRRRWRQ